MVHASKVEFGEVIDAAIALAREHVRILAGVGLAMAAVYSAFDLLSENASSIPSLIATIFIQYLITERLLADRLPADLSMRRKRYGAIFGSGILIGLGVIVGLVFLIVPGVILLARWSMTTPFIVVDEMSSTQAMNASWEASRPSQVTLCLLYLVYGGMFMLLLGAAGAFVAFGGSTGTGEFGWVETIVADMAASALSLTGWVLAAAIYRTAVPTATGLTEVFA